MPYITIVLIGKELKASFLVFDQSKHALSRNEEEETIRLRIGDLSLLSHSKFQFSLLTNSVISLLIHGISLT